MERKIEQLLMTKKFEELTSEEKYFVTEFMGEVQYDRLHVFLKESKKSLKKAPAINPAVGNKLMAAFRKEHGLVGNEKKPLLVRLINYRLPVWQAAAAIALLIGMHFWLKEGPQIITETDTVYVHSTDTIYKEVAMPAKVADRPVKSTQSRINVKPSMQKTMADSLADALVSIAPGAMETEIINMPDTFGILVSRPRGQSATQTADLWNLLSEVY